MVIGPWLADESASWAEAGKARPFGINVSGSITRNRPGWDLLPRPVPSLLRAFLNRHRDSALLDDVTEGERRDSS